jgi:hypothetical protein
MVHEQISTISLTQALSTIQKVHKLSIPLQETKKSYRQSHTNKTTAVCPGPLYNIYKIGISSYQEILSSEIFQETLRECTTYNKVVNSIT